MKPNSTNSAKRVIVVAEKSRAYGRALCEGIASFAQEQEGWALQLIDDIAGKDFHGFRGCSGVIARIVDNEAAAALQALKVPVVDILALKRYAGIAAVDNDQQLVGAWAAENFLERRFTRFAFCGYSGVAFSDARGEGFVKSVQAKGFDCLQFKSSGKKARALAMHSISHEHLALDCDRIQLGRWLKQLPNPIAIFCCHDARAYQVLTLCKQTGIQVPDQAAVMGVDDDQILCGFSSPMLSSIDPDAFGIGRAAAKQLSDMISDPGARRDACVRIPPKALITRASTQIYPVEPPWLSDALIYIGKNFAKGINADAVFRHVGRSHTCVDQAFKDILKTTVHKEIVRVRIGTAARLLRTTGYSATQIADMTGFTSPQHFSYAFRKTYHRTPESYRNASIKAVSSKLQIS